MIDPPPRTGGAAINAVPWKNAVIDDSYPGAEAADPMSCTGFGHLKDYDL
jgi:hypothetical protein